MRWWSAFTLSLLIPSASNAIGSDVSALMLAITGFEIGILFFAAASVGLQAYSAANPPDYPEFPDPPAPPTQDSPAVLEARRRAALEAQQGTGRRSTLLASSTSAEDPVVETKTVLGY